MLNLLRCSRGHEWEAPLGSQATAETVCPTCGATAILPAIHEQSATRLFDPPSPERGDGAVDGPGSRSSAAQPSRQIPGYDILSELGRGGMGVVYKARQVGLNRLVAIKMILGGSHAGADAIARFRAEAEAVAKLQHANIVQIYEIGEQEGRPYFALEFVDGGSLSQKLAGVPLPSREAAQIVEQLARAVGYAHEHGVIHRDLKPANVLIRQDEADRTEGNKGNEETVRRSKSERASSSKTASLPLLPSVSTWIPKITDFGLAKQVDVDSGQTRSGAIVGTPSYMSPEQAAGLSKEIGPAADIYSLGAMLYEMLTGRPPFRAATLLETLEQLRSQEPVPPSRLQPGLPRDVETICLKCLQKDAGKRYESAAALADDLAKFLNGEPITARPVSTTERVWRWAKRKPLLAGLYATVAVLLLAVIVVPSVLAFRLDVARRFADEETGRANRHLKRANEATDNAKAQQKIAETQAGIAQRNEIKAKDSEEKAKAAQARAEAEQKAAEWSRYVAEINLAQQAAEKGKIGPMLAQLEGLRPEPGKPDLRGPEWYLLWHSANRGLRATYRESAWPLSSVVCSPDGKTIAIGGSFGFIRLLDRETGKVQKTLLGHTELITALNFSPDGTTLASSSVFNDVKLWDVATGEARGHFPALTPRSNRLAFSPDGRWAAAATTTDVRLIDLASGEEHGKIETDRKIAELAFSSDSRLLAACADQDVQLWDVETGQRRFQQRHGFTLNTVALSPDGKWLASAGNPALRLWDTETGSECATVGGASTTMSMAFSPDSQRLAAASGGSIKLYELGGSSAGETSILETHSFGHAGRVDSLVFTPDGESLISGGGDRAVKVWDLAAPASAVVKVAKTPVWSIAISPDGNTAYTAADGTIRAWDTHTGQERFALAGRGGLAVAVSPDGKLLAAEQVQVTLYDAQTGQVVRRLHDGGHGRNFWSLAFSPDGQILAGGGQDGTARLWDVATGREEFATPRGAGWVRVVTFSPDGRTLALANANGSIDLWDVRGGAGRRSFTAHRGHIFSLQFSPLGETLLSTGNVGPARLWDTATGQERHVEWSKSIGTVTMGRAAWLADGQAIVSSAGPEISFWDTTTGRRRATLPTSADTFFSLTASTNGQLVAAGGHDGSLHLWHLPTEPVVFSQSAFVDPRERTALRQLLSAIEESQGGHSQQARAAYQKARDLAAELSERFPDNPAFAQWQSRAQYDLHRWLAYLKDEIPAQDAEKASRDSIALGERLVARFPDEYVLLENLARSYAHLGSLLKDAEAIDCFERAAKRFRELHDRFADLEAANFEAQQYWNIGVRQRRLDQRPLAEASMRQALAILEGVVTQRIDHTKFVAALAHYYSILAVILAERGEHQDAETLMDKLAAISLSDVEEQEKLVIQLVRLVLPEELRRTQRAVELANQLVESHPSRPGAWSALGHAYFANHDYAAAVTAFDRSYELSNKVIDPYDGLAMTFAHWHLGSPRARPLYEELKRPEVRGSLENGDLPGMSALLAELDRLLGDTPANDPKLSDAQMRLVRGRAALRLKLFDIAIFHFKKLAELRPDDADAWMGIGQAQIELGRFDEALESFDSVLNLKSDDPEALNHKARVFILRATVRFKADQFQKDGSDCEAAIAVDPNNGLAWFLHGMALGNAGQWEQAVARFDKAADLGEAGPENWQWHLGRALRFAGDVQLRRGESDTALATYNRSLAECERLKSEKNAWSYNELAWSLRTRGKAWAAQRRQTEADADFAAEQAARIKWLELGRNDAGLRGIYVGDMRKLPVADAARWSDVARHAVKVWPTDTGCWTALGIVAYRLGRWSEANAALQKSLELQPDGDGWTWFYAAMTRWKLDEQAAASESYDRGFDWLSANRAWLAEHAAEASTIQSVRDEAAKLLGRPIDALADLTRAIEQSPKNADAWLRRARFHSSNKEWDNALADYAQVLDLKRDDANLWSERAAIYGWNRWRWDMAVTDLTRAIELRPDDTKSFVLRARGYMELSQYDKAVADSTKVIELEPAPSIAWGIRGRAKYLAGRYDDAAPDLAKAVELNVVEGTDWLFHATLLLKSDQSDAYRQHAAATLKTFNDTTNAYYATAAARACALFPDAIEEPQRVVELAERAHKSVPKHPHFLNTLALAQHRAGQHAAAIATAEECLKLHSTWAPQLNWLVLALAHHALGHTTDARDNFTKADAWLTEQLTRLANSPADTPPPHPHHWLEIQLLHREAKARLK